MKNKFKSYTFWLALIGAVIILVNTLGTTFGFNVNEVAITSIATAVLGIFVTLGLVHKDSKTEQDKKDENLDQNQEDEQQLESSKNEDDTKEKNENTDHDNQG